MAAGLGVVDTSAWIEWLSTIFFCQARDFNLDNAAMTEAIHLDVCIAFAEDRQMFEAQAKFRSRCRQRTEAGAPVARARPDAQACGYSPRHATTWPRALTSLQICA